MKNIIITIFLVLTIAAFAIATPLTMGYPEMCTDDPVSPTREGTEWKPCSVSPGKSGPTAVAGSDVEVFSSRLVLKDVNFCFYFKNEGGGGGSALTDLDVLVNPDNQTGNWHSLSFTSCDTITSGQMCTYCVDGNAYAYVKVEANATDTTVSVWYTANRG